MEERPVGLNTERENVPGLNNREKTISQKRRDL